MKILQNLILLMAGYHVLATKHASKSRHFDYEHEPYRSFHLPWAIKYPQPVISIDGPWPIGSPTSLYPYQYHIPKEDDYNYEDFNYQHELLIKSLNRALTKLNRLLPPTSSNLQETTPFPPSTEPGVIAEALNKAIDRLGVLLTRQPLPLNSDGVKNKETTVAPVQISGSVSSAINDLDKLFATLPDELKATPDQIMNNNNTTVNTPKPIVTDSKPIVTDSKPIVTDSIPIVTDSKPIVTDSKPIVTDSKPIVTDSIPIVTDSKPIVTDSKPIVTDSKPIVTDSKPIGPPAIVSLPLFVSEPNINDLLIRNQATTTEGKLFTSHPFKKVTTTEKSLENNNDIIPFTSIPEILNNFGTSTEKPDKNGLFTSFVTSSVSPIDVTNNTENTDASTELPTESTVILPTGNSENINTSTELPTEGNTVFPTENNVFSINETETEITTINNDITTPYIPKIDIRFKEKEEDSFIFPDQFEEMTKENKKPLEIINLASRIQEKPISIANFKPVQSSTPITLGFKPARPPFHPDVFPPHPTARPQNESNPQTSILTDLSDRKKQTTVFQQLSTTQRPVNTQNPQIILEYKPSRPPFHPDVFPPHPTPRPQTDSPQQTSNFELGDRNKPTTLPNPSNNNNVQSTTTEIIFTTTQNNAPYQPTHYYSTPINLEYKPTRPFYAPNPIFYPKPRPWPVSVN